MSRLSVRLGRGQERQLQCLPVLTIPAPHVSPFFDLPPNDQVVESWSKPIDAPMNMFIVSIPTVLDPSLAPEGKHLVHIYTAGNEPYTLWEGLKLGSPEYKVCILSLLVLVSVREQAVLARLLHFLPYDHF